MRPGLASSLLFGKTSVELSYCERLALSTITVTMIVCVCNRLTESDVRQAARSGATTPESAYAAFGCDVQCGCCLDYAEEMLSDEHGKRPRLRLVPKAA